MGYAQRPGSYSKRSSPHQKPTLLEKHQDGHNIAGKYGGNGKIRALNTAQK
jgi:hypothetical protein